MSILHLCLLILFMLTLTNAAKKKGDPCRLPERNIGQCKTLDDCPKAKYDLIENNKWPVPCGSDLYCCDDVNKSEKSVRPKTPPQTAETLRGTVTTDNKIRRYPNNYGRKSEEKCQEYSTWKDVPTLMLGGGKVAGLCSMTIEPTIVGGKEAKPSEFPHMAKLIYSNPKHLCGASLISEQFLLTAAHCIQGSAGPISAILGTGDIRFQKDAIIAKSFIHPDYRPPEKYNDIALLQLTKPVHFEDSLRPACLQIENYIGDENVTAIASGWGKTGQYEGLSDKLLKVNLPLVSHSKCKQTYYKTILLKKSLDENSMLCAGGYDTNKDTCNGDSGGPLQIAGKVPSCMYRIIGITSFGPNACGPTPGVYTKVSNYVPWIESIVWPDSQ